MSDQREPAPPVAEEIHLPGPTVVPLVLAVGVTLVLIGLTTFTVLIVIGAVTVLWALQRWIRDARKEFTELPLDHR